MPTRFDHAVIAVRDLDTAIKQYQRLGFDAQPGGRHTGRGSHNGLVRFGLDYVELLSIYDEAEARAFSHGGPIITDALHGKDAALVGYALATTEIEEEAKRFTGTDTKQPEPHPMQRKRPDGGQLSWRTLSPGNAGSWGKAWPFLIQWDTPDEQRLQIDQPGTHANGATGWVRVEVAVRDLDSTLDIYRNQLGLELIKQDHPSCQVANRATLSIGKGIIALLAPDGEGPVQHVLSEKGEGPYELSFVVKNLEQTHAFLQERGIKFERETDGKLVLDPGETLGVRINLV